MTFRTTWSAPESILREAEIILTELIDPPVDAASLVRDDDASAEPQNAPWLLHVYTDHRLPELVIDKLPPSIGDPYIEELKDQDWVAHSLAGLGIVRAGPFVLYGSHDADKVHDSGELTIQIEANQAFGTGHHPTTAGCLEALASIRTNQPKSVLDVGTGSGVLSFAARKLWPSADILASDIDATSVAIAEDNGKINGIQDIRWIVAEGTDSALIKESAPFDLVIANILAGPLISLAPEITKVISPAGFVILAGLLDEQEERVVATYAEHGLTLCNRGGTPRWPTLTLQGGPGK